MILRQYEENGYLVTEYTRDGKSISSVEKVLKYHGNVTEPEQPTSEISVEEMQARILLNTEYLVSRAELGLLLGGM